MLMLASRGGQPDPVCLRAGGARLDPASQQKRKESMLSPRGRRLRLKLELLQERLRVVKFGLTLAVKMLVLKVMRKSLRKMAIMAAMRYVLFCACHVRGNCSCCWLVFRGCAVCTSLFFYTAFL